MLCKVTGHSEWQWLRTWHALNQQWSSASSWKAGCLRWRWILARSGVLVLSVCSHWKLPGVTYCRRGVGSTETATLGSSEYNLVTLDIPGSSEYPISQFYCSGQSKAPAAAAETPCALSSFAFPTLYFFLWSWEVSHSYVRWNVTHLNLLDSLRGVCALWGIRIGTILINAKTRFVVLVDDLLKSVSRLWSRCSTQNASCT